MKELTVLESNVVERLESLGFKTAAKEAAKKLDVAAKMKLAYEKYLFVPQDKIQAFNKKLMNETMQETRKSSIYKQLNFTPLELYPEIPPAHVLDALEEAQKLGCFDAFEIARIAWVEQVKDPILFGRVNECTDRFFIAQWDDDVKIDQLIFAE